MNKVVLSPQQKQSFKKMLDDLIGTRGAYILDQEMNILGKVPTTELVPTIRSLNSVFAVVFDGTINRDITNIADRSNVKYLVGMESRVRSNDIRADILVNNDF
jgi:hypothetical protein